MEAVFIEAKSNVDVKKVIEKAMKQLKGKIGIITTSQHKHELKKVQKILGDKAVIGGQILGCEVSAAKKVAKEVNAFLYIGSGEFHPLGVALETGKKVVIANPLTNEVSEIDKKDVEDYKKKQKGALLKFLSSKEIGIVVSTKSGQENLKKAIELKKKLKDKNCYVFLTDLINSAEFDNFPFIESWVNTACPRFADDQTGVINVEMVEETFKR